MSGPGRNDPCPCGSGAKYKRCCLDRDARLGGDSQRRRRPTPLQALTSRQEELHERLRARPDRYAQLTGKALVHEEAGLEVRSASGLDEKERAELEALAPQAAAAYRVEIEEATARLRALLAASDPLHVLAAIKMMNLLAAPGAYYEPTHRGLESRVELAAGLLLTQPAASGCGAVDAAKLREIDSQMVGLEDALLLRNLAERKGEDPATAELKFTSALHWMSLRGTSYQHHGADLARALFAPYGDWCLSRYGFTVDDVLNVAEAEDEFSRTRLNALLTAAHDLADRIKAKAESGTLRKTLSAAERARFEAPGMTEMLGYRAFEQHLIAGIADASTFAAQDLAGPGLPVERVEAVLGELSLSVGALAEDDYSGLFDKSPLVERPFVESNGRFLLAVPGMALRDTVGLFESRLLGKARGYPKSRAKALDNLAVKYVVDVLPGSQGLANLYYEDAELDGLVVFERIAFVVEGKASSLSVAAQRGDVERLGRDVARAVEDAWRQGSRAREYILRDAPAVFSDEKGREALRLEAGSIDEALIVNPTLHQLAGHASQLPRLQALGLFPEGDYPWSVFINDLRVISETAGNPAVFVHYLAWRSRLPLGNGVSVADELDLWGSYLMAERFGRLADGGTYVVGNSSTDFDAYYEGLLGRGPQAPRPQKFLKEPVVGFVERLADERPAGWLGAAGTCLDLSLPELAYVSASADDVARQARAQNEIVVEEAGRVRLVGMPRACPAERAIEESEAIEGDATFHLYLRRPAGSGCEITWAKTVGSVTFELSEFERQAVEHTVAALSRAQN
jgi:hypothetical protein